MTITLKFTDLSKKLFEILKSFSGKQLNLFTSGGSVLKLFKEDISELDTSQWTVYFVDERITTNIDDLNWALAEKTFFKFFRGNYLKLTNENLHIYDEVIDKQMIELAIIGMGEDGHIASLFPHMGTGFYVNFSNELINKNVTRETLMANLDSNTEHSSSERTQKTSDSVTNGVKSKLLSPYILEIDGSPKPPPKRYSLTPLALSKIQSICIFVSAGAKRKERILPHDGILKSVKTEIIVYHPEEMWSEDEKTKILKDVRK
ncbi:6-phosphogluconolactonase - like protein [Pseudoloma neurophilia]|uniref:6-phosphogluconolactonase-like protein n=1 Tax=Pseudoloma neurophilia TaxID=146866 RepID=A0A0R0LYN9_9MICR|nr:6-phosphogluconolactonase - like protein [Pseudoloma neurophilia]